ncbi:MAG: antibiotic biosynthesis monooxygenase [Rhodomicrobium sp.]|nr:MAG: antibiotic biosynthesis monooxygenase [Rhodomicrobium sp.]
MYAVIFEVKLKEANKAAYLAIAGALREELVTMEGFISIERFQSLVEESKLLSLSFWESEEAILKWKARPNHMAAQLKGRDSLFEDYRIRIARVERDYTLASSDFEPS